MQNQNSSVTQEIRDVTRSQDATAVLPSSFSPSIQLVAEVNPKSLRVANKSKALLKSTTGAAVIHATAVDKDTYVTSVILSVSKTAACDIAAGFTVISYNHPETGATSYLAQVANETLTASANTMALAFSCPIKVRPGSNISLSGNTFTAGAFTAQATVHYFEL